MFDDPIDDPLDDPMDDAELALVIEIRERQTEQRRLRTRVLRDLGERVEVHCRLHLVPPEAERELYARLRELEDQIAVMRHSEVRDDAAYEDALAQRASLTAAVHARVVDVALAIGRPPREGLDWALSDVPAAALDDIAAAWAAMRRELVRMAELLVGSDLVFILIGAETAAGGTTADGTVAGRTAAGDDPLVDLALRQYDAESVAQVEAFAREVRRLDELAQRCTERVRRMALRAVYAHPRGWLAQNRLRSREAREALDMVRAVQAARAELQMISRSG